MYVLIEALLRFKCCLCTVLIKGCGCYAIVKLYGASCYTIVTTIQLLPLEAVLVLRI